MVRLFKAFFLLTVLALLAPQQSDAMIRQSASPDMYASATCLADEARTPIFDETPEYVVYLVETGEGRYWVICRNDPVNKVDPFGLEGGNVVSGLGQTYRNDFGYAELAANEWTVQQRMLKESAKFGVAVGAGALTAGASTEIMIAAGVARGSLALSVGSGVAASVGGDAAIQGVSIAMGDQDKFNKFEVVVSGMIGGGSSVAGHAVGTVARRIGPTIQNLANKMRNAGQPGGSGSSAGGLILNESLVGIKAPGVPLRSSAHATAPEARMTTVLGSGRDVGPYANRHGFNVLNMDNLPESEWPRQNALWLNQAIRRGDNIWLVTDPAKHTQLMQQLGRSSFYLDLELPMLQEYSGVSAIPKYIASP